MNAPTAPSSPQNAARVARLRILATTDLHGHLLPYDYIKDRPTQESGLAGISSLIKDARAQAEAEGTPVLLFDNGDTFQGTPLADFLAAGEVGPEHAIVACLNHLRYDALGLGNHDLDYGLPYLKAVARALDMPLVNSNLRNVDLAPLQACAVITVPLGDAAPAPLRVGVLSVLPEQSAAWHSHHLGAQTSLAAPDALLAVAVQDLRAKGADLVVVLGHMGVGQADHAVRDMRAAHALVQGGQIDALLLGHTHRRLPSSDYAGRKGVNSAASTIGGVPALMAGHAGSDLGVMDLELAHEAGSGWRITGHACALRPNGRQVPADPAIEALAAPVHRQVVAKLARPVARARRVLHSYFSLVSPATTQALTARAQHALIRDALAGTPHARLPLLSAAAALGAGGRDGPKNYTHVPSGPLLQRHIAGLVPFANQAVGIRVTGADLRRWLEHAALLFRTQSRDTPAQMLINTDVPAFQFDTVFGLNYDIDPSAPPFTRITELRHAGAPVAEEDTFILATNQFRAAGGGGYPQTATENIVAWGSKPLDAAMIDCLNSDVTCLWDELPAWRFRADGAIDTHILTHPDALDCLDDIAHLQPRLAGGTPEGFIKLAITL